MRGDIMESEGVKGRSFERESEEWHAVVCRVAFGTDWSLELKGHGNMRNGDNELIFVHLMTPGNTPEMREMATSE